MQFKSPSFWWTKKGLIAYLLLPLSIIYAYFARQNFNKKNIKLSPMPTLCIGNYTLGGSGKTPMAILLARQALSMGLRVAIISRGYGGSYKKMHVVDTELDCVTLVGDEALLLARHAKTIVTKNRAIAAEFLYSQGYDFLIMDDGFQSRQLYYDYALIALDAGRGLGNGFVFPSGPLRAPMATQSSYSDAVVAIGPADAPLGLNVTKLYRAVLKPIMKQAANNASHHLHDKDVFSFCAIGNAAKFHNSIVELGGNIKIQRVFADHYFFKPYELKEMIEIAKAENLSLATTQKDYVRLANNKPLQHNWSGPISYMEFLHNLIVLDVELVFAASYAAKNIINHTLEKHQQRLASLI